MKTIQSLARIRKARLAAWGLMAAGLMFCASCTSVGMWWIDTTRERANRRAEQQHVEAVDKGFGERQLLGVWRWRENGVPLSKVAAQNVGYALALFSNGEYSWMSETVAVGWDLRGPRKQCSVGHWVKIGPHRIQLDPGEKRTSEMDLQPYDASAVFEGVQAWMNGENAGPPPTIGVLPAAPIPAEVK